jgi:hypothetical protein
VGSALLLQLLASNPQDPGLGVGVTLLLELPSLHSWTHLSTSCDGRGLLSPPPRSYFLVVFRLLDVLVVLATAALVDFFALAGFLAARAGLDLVLTMRFPLFEV